MKITVINECIKCDGFTVGYYTISNNSIYATWRNNNGVYSNVCKSSLKEIREFIKMNFIKYM